MTSAISCPLWSSVYECQRVECAFTSPVRTECGMFVIYCMQYCMSVLAVPYVDEVVAVTVMRVLLFVFHGCLLRGCEVDGNAGVGMDEVW